jgi:O-antigen/teichoic acid export membrane protein
MNKKFFFFTGINLLDKFLLYLLPLIPLYIFKDHQYYNLVEFVYSLSLFFSIFADGGIKNFYLSNFRHYKNINLFSNSLRKYINNLIIFYFILLPFILFSFFLYENENFLLIALLVFFRTIFLVIINFNKVYYAVKQTQIKMLYITLLSSISTLFIFILIYFFNTKNNILYFFFVQIVIVLIIFFISLFRKEFLKNFQFVSFFKKSLKFSWPLILNSLFFFIIMHFAKIYSYTYLSSQDMTKISFFMRTLFVIQLFHGIFTNYYYFSIFENKEKKINVDLLVKYILGMALISIITFAFFEKFSYILNLEYKIDLIFICIFLYFIFWCFGSFFEQYLNKFNSNKHILTLSMISLCIYVLILLFSDFAMIERLVIAMLFSSLIYLSLILIRVFFIIK